MDVSTVKTPPTQAAPPPKRMERTDKAQPANNETQKLQEAAVKKAANAQSPAQPVINTQGHSTGRLLNVTA